MRVSLFHREPKIFEIRLDFFFREVIQNSTRNSKCRRFSTSCESMEFSSFLSRRSLTWLKHRCQNKENRLVYELCSVHRITPVVILFGEHCDWILFIEVIDSEQTETRNVTTTEIDFHRLVVLMIDKVNTRSSL